MWWRKNHAGIRAIRASMRVGLVLAAAGLVAGCFQPLYGRDPAAGNESIRDKLADVLVAPIAARKGTVEARVAVELRNALQYYFNGGAGAVAPTHRLDIEVTATDVSVTLDPVSGRPTEEIGGLNASYQLLEIATGKIVLKDNTFARVGYEIPGPQQRFAKHRAQVDAQDRAAKVAAETIRNRLASYFVAGT
jgi:LPS-assembly lipoprotein